MEVPGPANFEVWQASWKVFSNVLLGLTVKGPSGEVFRSSRPRLWKSISIILGRLAVSARMRGVYVWLRRIGAGRSILPGSGANA